MTLPGGAQAKIIVVTAGLGQPSATRLLGDRLAAATAAALEARGTVAEIEVVELRELARDLTNHLLTGVSSPALTEVRSKVSAADAVIAVSPIFSASYSGLFKLFFDVLDPDSLQDRPVLIAATGGSARHSLALEHAFRPLFSYLRARVVPTAVYAAPEDWASHGELGARIERAATELAASVRSVPVAPPRDEELDMAEVVPFTRLLADQRSAPARRRQ